MRFVFCFSKFKLAFSLNKSGLYTRLTTKLVIQRWSTFFIDIPKVFDVITKVFLDA